MSGVKVSNYANDDSDILAVQSTLDKALFGKIDAITLTEFDSSTVPAISAGSVIECNGALYSFASEEAISTTDPVTSATVADGTVYVCLVPSTSTITAAFTATAPTWSDSKQGWYGTGGQANYRYIAGAIKDSTLYVNKHFFTYEEGVNNTFVIAVQESLSEESTTSSISYVSPTTPFSRTITAQRGQTIRIFYQAEVKTDNASYTTTAQVNVNGSVFIDSDSTPDEDYGNMSAADRTLPLSGSISTSYEIVNYKINFFVFNDGEVTLTDFFKTSNGSGTASIKNRKFFIKIIDTNSITF